MIKTIYYMRHDDKFAWKVFPQEMLYIRFFAGSIVKNNSIIILGGWTNTSDLGNLFNKTDRILTGNDNIITRWMSIGILRSPRKWKIRNYRRKSHFRRLGYISFAISSITSLLKTSAPEKFKSADLINKININFMGNKIWLFLKFKKIETSQRMLLLFLFSFRVFEPYEPEMNRK